MGNPTRYSSSYSVESVYHTTQPAQPPPSPEGGPAGPWPGQAGHAEAQEEGEEDGPQAAGGAVPGVGAQEEGRPPPGPRRQEAPQVGPRPPPSKRGCRKSWCIIGGGGGVLKALAKPPSWICPPWETGIPIPVRETGFPNSNFFTPQPSATGARTPNVNGSEVPDGGATNVSRQKPKLVNSPPPPNLIHLSLLFHRVAHTSLPRLWGGVWSSLTPEVFPRSIRICVLPDRKITLDRQSPFWGGEKIIRWRVFLCVCVRECLCVYACVRVLMCLCLRMCVLICLKVFVRLRVCVYVCVCLLMCLCLRMCFLICSKFFLPSRFVYNPALPSASCRRLWQGSCNRTPSVCIGGRRPTSFTLAATVWPNVSLSTLPSASSWSGPHANLCTVEDSKECRFVSRDFTVTGMLSLFYLSLKNFSFADLPRNFSVRN